MKKSIYDFLIMTNTQSKSFVQGIFTKNFSCLSSVPEKKTSMLNGLTDGLTYRKDKQN